MNIDYSLFPNLDGNLGQNKVKIPDGVNVQWPDGDILVGNFVYKNGIVSALIDTKALIANDSKTTTIPYDYFDVTFESIKEGDMTFIQGERCKYFTINYIFGTSEPETPSYTELTSVRIGETQQINTQYIPTPNNFLFEIRCKINNLGSIPDNYDFIFHYKNGPNMESLFPHVSYNAYQGLFTPYCVVWANTPLTGKLDLSDSHTIKREESSISDETTPAYAPILAIDDSIRINSVPFTIDPDSWETSFGNASELVEKETLCVAPSIIDLTVEWFKIYDGSYNEEDLVCDMIPAQIENGTQGLFDKKRNIFLPIETITENAATYSLRNNSPTIEEIIRMIAEEKGISLES